MMMGAEEVAGLIKSHIKDARVQVTDLVAGQGKHAHHGIVVVSDMFEGRPLLEQHQMIMDILREKLKRDIHAVKIKTLTYASARQKGMLGE